MFDLLLFSPSYSLATYKKDIIILKTFKQEFIKKKSFQAVCGNFNTCK